MRKALIGMIIDTGFMYKGVYKKEIEYINRDYVNAIQKNGGVPIFISSFSQFNEVISILDSIDAMIIIGGDDISVACYSDVNANISNRDLLEIEAYKYMKKKDKPILGICRGMQIINVSEGGTLSNIENSKIKHYIEEDGWINYHPIKIERKTKMFDILGMDEYVMPSVHHQKLDKVAENVLVSSVSEDGVIESIEIGKRRFIIGIQGHIEKCLDNFPKYNKLIEQFIKEAQNEQK